MVTETGVTTGPRGLHVGKCEQLLATWPDASIDSVVTDPPYELGFMGKTWDSSGIAYSIPMWQEVLRVLKPGGHLLAFGGTRTYHRMACAIEDSGFEIRDSIHWLYGSGFPKSLDVSKAIDKKLGNERPVIGTETNWGASKAADGKIGYGDYAGAWDITAPASTESAKWSGWGTALKPAHEPIILARKPIVGTVAANVLAHGTGALNIDATRIGTDQRLKESSTGHRIIAADAMAGGNYSREVVGTVTGRWPANVVLNEHAAAELDLQTGTSVAGRPDAARTAVIPWAPGDGVPCGPQYGDKGGASRFFYCAKPSKSEKNKGLEHLPQLSGGDATGRVDASAGLNSPRAGAGRTGSVHNNHPTVKPLNLMRWLIRLVTPPNGVVLDPFLGSGTTAEAAILEGFQWVGCEMTADYVPLIEARVARGAAQWATENPIKPTDPETEMW